MVCAIIFPSCWWCMIFFILFFFTYTTFLPVFCIIMFVFPVMIAFFFSMIMTNTARCSIVLFMNFYSGNTCTPMFSCWCVVSSWWIIFMVDFEWIFRNLIITCYSCVIIHIEFIFDAAKVIFRILVWFLPRFSMSTIFIKFFIVQQEIFMFTCCLTYSSNIPCTIDMEIMTINLYKVPCVLFWRCLSTNINTFYTYLS